MKNAVVDQMVKRLAVTPKLILTVKHWLRQSQLEPYDRLLVWVICSWWFFGAFRIRGALGRSIELVL